MPKKIKLTINITEPKKQSNNTGKWCEYYNRLPSPIECQNNCDIPMCHQRPNCKKCERKILISVWKQGKYRDISNRIDNGENLSHLPCPI